VTVTEEEKGSHRRGSQRGFSVANLKELQLQLPYQFRELSLLQLALTHPSVAHEQGTAIQHNQRLEFLGDSILGVVLTRELYERFPELGEGPLTKARAHMVNRWTLAELARKLQLGDYLLLSRGEEANGGRDRASALADAFEAVIGAVFLDGGFESVCDFVVKLFEPQMARTVAPIVDNPKGELQEMLQAVSLNSPEYQIHAVSGPDHDRLYECSVRHDGKELGRGKGKSKKAAETEAAVAALETLRLLARPVI